MEKRHRLGGGAKSAGKDSMEKAVLYNIMKQTALYSQPEKENTVGLDVDDEDGTDLFTKVTECDLVEFLSPELASSLFPRDSNRATTEKQIGIHNIEKQLEQFLFKVVRVVGCKTPSEAVDKLADTLSHNRKSTDLLSQLDRQEIELHEQIAKLHEDIVPQLTEMMSSMKKSNDLTELEAKLVQKRSEALQLRSELLQCEILSELYSEEKVNALNKIHDHLEREIVRCENELKRTEQTLAQYQVLGPEFHRIVQEFREVKKLIESRNFVLYNCTD